MLLLETGAFRKELADALSSAEQEVIVLSAFIKLDALKWLVETSKTSNLKIVARWQLSDLVAGASDLECYQLCDEANIPFGISQNLHGKVYIVDSKIFIGSANLTSKGMSLSHYENDEFGTGFEYGHTEKTKVRDYLGTVNWLDRNTVELMADFLASFESNTDAHASEWPQDIFEKLDPQPIGVWFHDLPMCSPKQLLEQTATATAIEHDLDCFRSPNGAEEDELLKGFMSSQICFWLETQLQEFGELSFGKVTSLFHDQILDDPMPYRQYIKEGIANLFEWACVCESKFEVARPKHSQIIRAV
jgi:hypothetical protein